MTVRTRFAPSPTGYLHVGGARTALYCWLYAHKMQGKFALRIEDTDLERSTPAHIQTILDAMEWLGLHWDEGPFYQTQRFDRYKELIQKLLDEGKAYRCYCSKERLEGLRECQLANKDKPRYDGYCRNLKEFRDCPYVIRFRNPEEGSVKFNDLVHGPIEFQNCELDDLIIARADGSPTYNFCVVVDDYDMGITHVIRGDDHINNTPRQINILKALGAEPPQYAHVPMILGDDGKRLSKRHGAVDVMLYRKEGYLPEALLNYLVRLGWSHGDQEIFSIEEMVNLFDIKDVNKAPAAFNTEKLQWLNQHYLKTSDPHRVAQYLKWNMEDEGIDIARGPDLTELVQAQAERCKTLHEMVEKSRFFYEEFDEYDEKAAQKNLTGEAVPVLQAVLNRLEALTDWKAEPIHQTIIDTAETLALKLGKVAQPVRVAVTGGAISPPIDITIEMIGRERTLRRMEKAIEFINSQD